MSGAGLVPFWHWSPCTSSASVSQCSPPICCMDRYVDHKGVKHIARRPMLRSCQHAGRFAAADSGHGGSFDHLFCKQERTPCGEPSIRMGRARCVRTFDSGSCMDLQVRSADTRHLAIVCRSLACIASAQCWNYLVQPCRRSFRSWCVMRHRAYRCCRPCWHGHHPLCSSH